jgi:hypothetical protein
VSFIFIRDAGTELRSPGVEPTQKEKRAEVPARALNDEEKKSESRVR